MMRALLLLLAVAVGWCADPPVNIGLGPAPVSSSTFSGVLAPANGGSGVANTHTATWTGWTGNDSVPGLGQANAFTAVNSVPGLTSATALTVPLYLGGTGTSSEPGGTFVGSVLWGDQDGTTAAVAGQVGEVLAAGNASYANLTATGTWQALNSISVTPGYWMVNATVTFFNNGATVTTNNNALLAVSTSATASTGALEGASLGYLSQNGFLGSADKDTVTLAFPLNLAATTNEYLVAQATFSAGNVQTVSHLHFLRIR
jgi:hypothetical protein